jgi:phage FluMu protein Com
MTDSCMEKLRCNMCDLLLDPAEVSGHLEGRGHAVKKKVAEFNEMNALVGRHYDSNVSVVNAWIRNLHVHDFLSSGQA